MKNLYLIVIVFLFTSHTARTQSPAWEWAKTAAQAGGGGNEAICSDAAGNVYVTGGFVSPGITFGSYTLVNHSLSGGNNIFLVKYDSSGTVLWAKSAGGTATDAATGISTDASGGVFVTGFYTSQSIVFGNDTFTNNLPGVAHNFFLVKYDANGNMYWATNAGIAGTNNYQSMSADVSGNVYTTGSFAGYSAIIETDTLKNTHRLSGNSDIYIVKYNLTGGIAWAKSAGGIATNSLDYGQSVTADASGNIYVSGYFTNDTIHFGRDTLKGSGFLLLKYDSTGAEIWAKSAGGPDFLNDNAQSMSTDVWGNIFVTGDFSGATIIFGNATLNNPNSAGGSTAVYLVKYSPSGNVLWANGGGGTGINISNSISTDALGNAFITGNFSSNFITFGNDGVANSGNGIYTGGIFVVKYDSAGNVIWVLGNGGEANDAGTGITADAFGDIYITGSFQGQSITFGSIVLSDADSSDYDFYLAKLGNHAATAGIQGANNFSNQINVYPNPSTGSFCFSGINTSNTIEIYNVLGETVYSSTVNTSNYWLNLSSEAKGIYFYRISEPGGQTTGSLPAGEAGRPTTIQQGKIVLQ